MKFLKVHGRTIISSEVGLSRKVEATFLMSAIVMGFNKGLFLFDRNQAIFILILTAMVWTLIASWQLQRTLIDFAKFETSRNDLGFEEDIDIAYSDDEESSDSLKDESIGLVRKT